MLMRTATNIRMAMNIRIANMTIRMTTPMTMAIIITTRRGARRRRGRAWRHSRP